MTNPTPPAAPEEPRQYSPFAALLSYLIPGLGQVAQGRVAKGLLFFVCLYGMFFAGMIMGDWQNVYIAQTAGDETSPTPWVNNSWHLPKGLANLYNRLHYAGQFWIGIAAWPALLQYNDMAPGFLKDFEKAPSDQAEMDINRDQGKRPDVGWVYTVIAGVLNILVIYDAFAGPAFLTDTTRREEPGPDSPRPQQEAAAL